VRTDYAAAGIPMMPVVAGERATRRQILLYALVLDVVTLLPWALGLAGRVFGVSALVLGAVFTALAVQVGLRQTRDDDAMRPEKRLFRYSIAYLFILFAMLVVDRIAGGAV